MTSSVFVVMGVSGCGKSAVAEYLANTCNGKFIEGDDLHTSAAKKKMSDGIPLNDSDRMPWLNRIVSHCSDIDSDNSSIFVTCSALKQLYRDKLGGMPCPVYFIYLALTQETARERVMNRKGHFFPEKMVASQFNTLEAPNDTQNNVIVIDANQCIEQVFQTSLENVTRVIRGE